MRGVHFAGGALAGLLAACASSTPGEVASPTPVGAEARAAAPAPGGGREIAYAATPRARYRIERDDTVLVRLPDNTTQPQVFSRAAWVTVSTEKSAAGLRATIVLDSLDVGGMMREAAAASIDSARGTRWTANVAPDGRVSEVSADRTTQAGDQVGSLLQLLFPILPGKAIRAGASWTDTLETARKVDLFDVTERAITQHLALSTAVRGGTTVLPIQANGSFTQSGTGTQSGQAMTVETAGNRRFTFYLGTDGIPAGLSGTETSDVTITVSAVGQSISATRSATVHITPLPAR